MKSHEPNADGNPPCRYQPVCCAFLRKPVWAIVTFQPDGSWQIVNCLDKDVPCYSLNCAFTTSNGQWPYQASTADPR